MESSSDQYPKGIEIVSGAVIRREDGTILLTRSPKWHNKWAMPGGHIESGETIIQAAQREAEEETGLKLKPVETFDYGELIGVTEFERPAHFIYFDTIFDVVGGEVRLDGRELTEYQWMMPQEALRLSDLAEGYRKTITQYCELVNDAARLDRK